MIYNHILDILCRVFKPGVYIEEGVKRPELARWIRGAEVFDFRRTTSRELHDGYVGLRFSIFGELPLPVISIRLH